MPPPAAPALRLSLSLARWLSGWAQLVFLGAQLLALALSPASYTPDQRQRIAAQMVAGSTGLLLGFTAFAALATVVITRIVVVTAQSYGLTQYALQVVIRVLVIELIPLCAALFVALRCTLPAASALGTLCRHSREGSRPLLLTEALPRLLAGVHASVLLAALSCVVAAVLAYLAVYGWSAAALPGYTRLFGQVFEPAVALIFLLKTAAFSLAVAVLPVASALCDAQDRAGSSPGRDLGMLARLFLVLLLIEVLSLMGNYA